MNDWILVIIAIAAGLIVGLLASRIVHAVIGSPNRPKQIQQAARPLASLALAVGIVGGLVAALGVIRPSALDQLTKDAINLVPKLMTAAIIVIAANVASAFATTALAPALGRMSTQLQRQILTAVKATIVALAALLAIGQLGVDTEVINLGVAAIFFGIAASLTLLIGLGGNGVARQVASGRALRRMVAEGDRVKVGDLEGEVLAIHPTAIEISGGSEGTVLVPSSHFIDNTVTIDRAEPEVDETPSL